MPSRVTDPPRTSYPGRPISTWASVLFPDPLGPMTAWTSPLRTVRETPRQDLPPRDAGAEAVDAQLPCAHDTTTRTSSPSISTP